MCKVLEDMCIRERNEGIQQGLQEGMRTMALRMVSDGTLALEKIAEISGLTLDEVKNLQAAQAAQAET